MHCANNLKQIALALHNYHTALGSFPPGGITEDNCCSTKSLTNWAVSILPYLEQQALYNRYDMTAYNEDPANEEVRESAVAVYCCPTDRDTHDLDSPESGPGAALQYRRGSYRCMSGRMQQDHGWPASSGGCPHPPMNWRGVLHTVGTCNLTVERMANVTDGTSCTLMIGEMASKTHPSRRTFWAYTYTSYNRSGAAPQSRALLADFDKCIAVGGEGGSHPCKLGWGSFHPGGLHFALCDGSVRFISTTIDMELFCDLATIAGGEPAQVPE